MKFSHVRFLLKNKVWNLLGNTTNFYFTYAKQKLLFQPFEVGWLSPKLVAILARSKQWKDIAVCITLMPLWNLEWLWERRLVFKALPKNILRTSESLDKKRCLHWYVPRDKANPTVDHNSSFKDTPCLPQQLSLFSIIKDTLCEQSGTQLKACGPLITLWLCRSLMCLPLLINVVKLPRIYNQTLLIDLRKMRKSKFQFQAENKWWYIVFRLQVLI